MLPLIWLIAGGSIAVSPTVAHLFYYDDVHRRDVPRPPRPHPCLSLMCILFMVVFICMQAHDSFSTSINGGGQRYDYPLSLCPLPRHLLAWPLLVGLFITFSGLACIFYGLIWADPWLSPGLRSVDMYGCCRSWDWWCREAFHFYLLFLLALFSINNSSQRVTCPLIIRELSLSVWVKGVLSLNKAILDSMLFIFGGLNLNFSFTLVLFSFQCLLINRPFFLMKLNKSPWLVIRVLRVSCYLSVGVLSYVSFLSLLQSSYFSGPIYGVLLIFIKLINKFLHILIRVLCPFSIGDLFYVRSNVGLKIGFGDTDYRYRCKGVLSFKYSYHFGIIYVSYKYVIWFMRLPKGYGCLKTLGPVCDTGMKSTWWSSLSGVVIVRCDSAYWNVGCGEVALECRRLVSFGSWLCWLSISLFFLRPRGVSTLSCSILFAPAFLWSLHDDRFDDLKDEDLFSQVAALRLYHLATHLYSCIISYISCYIVIYAINHRGLLHPM